MKRRTASLFVALLGLGLGLASADARAAGPAPESPKAIETAHALYEAGVEAYGERHYDEAYQQFKASWSLHQHGATAANLGACELQLGLFRDAAEHLAYALRLSPPDDASRPKFEAGLARATSRIGTVDVEAPKGADLLVDDAVAGRAPLADPVFVEPGAHRVRAVTSDGAKETTITIGAGERQHVVLTLAPAEPPPSAAATGAPAPAKSAVPAAPRATSDEGSGRRAAGFVVGGIGLAGVAVGAVFGVKAIRDNDESNAGHCDANDRCDQKGADLRSSSRTAGDLSTAFVLGGIALVGAGVVLYATAPSQSKNQAKVSVGPGSLRLSGTW